MGESHSATCSRDTCRAASAGRAPGCPARGVPAPELRSAAQSTAATVAAKAVLPVGARGGGVEAATIIYRRPGSGAVPAQRAPGSPACSIVASCTAASGAMTATSTAASGDEKETYDSVPANIIVFFFERLLDMLFAIVCPGQATALMRMLPFQGTMLDDEESTGAK